jgi:hypothetical protein
MTSNNNTPAVINVTPIGVTGKLIVSIEGRDWIQNLSMFGLTIESSEQEIMSAITPAIREEFNTDISNYYKVRKALNSQNVHIIPNSVAG